MKGYTTINYHFETSSNTEGNRKVRYKKESFKSYFNAQHLLIQLQPLERVFLEYLIEKSDNQNRIYIDSTFKSDFIKFLGNGIIQGTTKPPSSRDLTKTVQKLNKLGLLIEADSQAYYYINPKYFWKTSELERINQLKKIVEDRISRNKPINNLIDCSEDHFFGLKP